MPWKVSSVMEEKLRFILPYESGEFSMCELCQRCGISRELSGLWSLLRLAFEQPKLLPLPCGQPQR